MTDLRSAAQQALEALNPMQNNRDDTAIQRAISALRAALEQPNRAQQQRDAGFTRRPTIREMAALEQPEQEPLAWLESPYGSIRMNTTMRFQFPPQSLKWKIPLYTHPPRREWRGLTEEEVDQMAGNTVDAWECARAIEATLKERNA